MSVRPPVTGCRLSRRLGARFVRPSRRDPITVGHELPIRTDASLVRSLPVREPGPGVAAECTDGRTRVLAVGVCWLLPNHQSCYRSRVEQDQMHVSAADRARRKPKRLSPSVDIRQGPRQQPRQAGKHCPVGRFQIRTAHLPRQDRDLTPQHEHLDRVGLPTASSGRAESTSVGAGRPGDRRRPTVTHGIERSGDGTRSGPTAVSGSGSDSSRTTSANVATSGLLVVTGQASAMRSGAMSTTGRQLRSGRA